MRSINRNLVSLTPKKTLIDWSNSQNGPNDDTISIDEYSGHDNAINFLIPEFDSADEALQWMADDWKIWFDAAMEEWMPVGGTDYPLPPSWENLLMLFDIKFQSYILDSLPGPIRKSD